MIKAALAKKDAVTKVVAEYDATKLLKTPFKVVLIESVYHVLDDAGNVIETVVPDPEGLVKAVAQSRVLHPHKLGGSDLKFLRSALGKKAKELAKHIALSPEHLSRCEWKSCSIAPERDACSNLCVRVHATLYVKKKDDAEQIGSLVSQLFDALSVKSAHSIEDEIVLKLVLGRRSDEAGQPCMPANDDGLWDQQKTLRYAVG